MTRTVRRAGVKRKIRNQRINPRNHPKPNIKLLLSLFLISAAVGCASSYAVQTPALTIKEVVVRGIHCADKAQVHQAASSVLGKNIILLRKGPVLDRIRSVHEVESVKIGRTPPGKVWVELKERTAGGILDCGANCYLVQNDGLAFHKVARGESPARDAGIPVLEVTDHGRVSEGIRCSSRGVKCALQIAKLARERRLKVAKISVDRLGDICLNMGSGFYVKLGQPDEIAKKMSLLRDALVYKPSLAREAAYIDLSCPTAPVWKPKSGADSAS